MRAEKPDFSQLIRPWARRWGLPGIEAGIRVRYSRRLQRSLGRSCPERGEIVLHHQLQKAVLADLALVVCHEAAHIAAYQLYGASATPHGHEWATLVSLAGYAPTISLSELGDIKHREKLSTGARPTTKLVVHRCPVCQTERLARRVVKGWRCAECVVAGLEGRLETIRMTSP